MISLSLSTGITNLYSRVLAIKYVKCSASQHTNTDSPDFLEEIHIKMISLRSIMCTTICLGSVTVDIIVPVLQNHEFSLWYIRGSNDLTSCLLSITLID
jgi:hypothetical protein